jgi:hypothetical protein
MRTLSGVLLSFSFWVFCLLPNAAFAQTTNEQPFDLNSAWLITVNGTARSFVLQLSGGTRQGETGRLVLNAIFSFPRGKPTPISAELVESTQGRTLLLVTPIESKIVAVQEKDGSFTGTMTLKNGQAPGITVKRLSEAEFAEVKPQQDEGFAIKQVAANVPASCAAFIGGWTGKWRNYATGQWGDPRWIWVAEIDEKCIAKYSYEYGPEKPKNLKSAEIKGGALAVTCGGGQGTCTFTNHGDELWVAYTGSDGSNSTVFRKVTDKDK